MGTATSVHVAVMRELHSGSDGNGDNDNTGDASKAFTFTIGGQVVAANAAFTTLPSCSQLPAPCRQVTDLGVALLRMWIDSLVILLWAKGPSIRCFFSASSKFGYWIRQGKSRTARWIVLGGYAQKPAPRKNKGDRRRFYRIGMYYIRADLWFSSGFRPSSSVVVAQRNLSHLKASLISRSFLGLITGIAELCYQNTFTCEPRIGFIASHFDVSRPQSLAFRREVLASRNLYGWLRVYFDDQDSTVMVQIFHRYRPHLGMLLNFSRFEV